MYINLSVSALLEIYSNWTIIQQPIKARFVFTFLFLAFGFLSSIMYVGSSGIYLTLLVDEYIGVALLFICLSEIIIIIYGYGFKKFLAYVFFFKKKNFLVHKIIASSKCCFTHFKK